MFCHVLSFDLWWKLRSTKGKSCSTLLVLFCSLPATSYPQVLLVGIYTPFPSGLWRSSPAFTCCLLPRRQDPKGQPASLVCLWPGDVDSKCHVGMWKKFVGTTYNFHCVGNYYVSKEKYLHHFLKLNCFNKTLWKNMRPLSFFPHDLCMKVISNIIFMIAEVSWWLYSHLQAAKGREFFDYLVGCWILKISKSCICKV